MRSNTIFLFFISLFALSLIAASGGEISTELIKWSPDKKLTWNDFQGKPTGKLKETKAVTWTKLKGRPEVFVDRIEYDYSCYFNKEKSWHAGNFSSPLLNHEQGHFDIAEVYARKFRKALSQHVSIKMSATGKFLDSLEMSIENDEKNFTNVYEMETDSSRNTQGQAKWDLKIKMLLEETKVNSSTLVIIKRKF